MDRSRGTSSAKEVRRREGNRNREKSKVVGMEVRDGE